MTTAKRAAAVAATIEGTSLTLTFAHGQTLRLDAARLDPSIREQAMLHGLKQKLVDAAAIGRNPDTGRSATIADKFEAVREIFDRITGPNPTWNKVRGGESSGLGGNSLLLRALMRITGKPRETLVAFLESKSKEERAALRKQSRVASVILEIQAEEAAKTIDTDGLLDELLGAGDDGNDPELNDGEYSDDEEAPF